MKRRSLYLVGLLVLLAGYSGAALVWRAQDRIDRAGAVDQAANEADPLAPLDSRQTTRQVELYYGKSGLLMERTAEWIRGLTHGRPLAKSLVVLSSLGGIVCFIVAGRRRC